MANRSVEVFACELGITASHLNDTIKTVTGLTAGQIIRQTLALEAKRILGSTDLAVYQIAFPVTLVYMGN